MEDRVTAGLRFPLFLTGLPFGQAGSGPVAVLTNAG